MQEELKFTHPYNFAGYAGVHTKEKIVTVPDVGVTVEGIVDMVRRGVPVPSEALRSDMSYSRDENDVTNPSEDIFDAILRNKELVEKFKQKYEASVKAKQEADKEAEKQKIIQEYLKNHEKSTPPTSQVTAPSSN